MFKRVAKEGATTDGRNISREWLQQIADNYDPKTYGARIWLEHMRGLLPDGPFAALGDIKAVKTEEDSDGKLVLLADMDPTDNLKAMNENRQKVYSSVEIDPNFADSGEAYLIGVAVTDSPASLGTEMLAFSAQQGDKSPLAQRKQSSRNVFSAAAEIDLDFSEDDAADDPEDGDDKDKNKPSLLTKIKGLLSRHQQSLANTDQAFRQELEQTLELVAGEIRDAQQKLHAAPSAQDYRRLQDAHDKLREDFDALYARLDREPDTPPRAPATGGEGGVELTDC